MMRSDLKIIAGDAGATKTVLALFEISNGSASNVLSETYKSAGHESLESILCDFIVSNNIAADAACIGVPGPVNNGSSFTTNLPWRISEIEVKKASNLREFRLANDLELIAHSLDMIPEGGIRTLHPGSGECANGNKAVIAPGTGLGHAFVVSGIVDTVVPTEGGHADFAPADKIQMRLHSFVSEVTGHVSLERLISGPGIETIYAFMASGEGLEGCALVENASDKARAVSECALRQEEGICREAMKMFASLLGAHAGNMALTLNAKGGIYLAGGIPAKNIPLLEGPEFRNSYLSKGRLSDYVADCPVHVVTHPNPGLLGALKLASRFFDA